MAKHEILSGLLRPVMPMLCLAALLLPACGATDESGNSRPDMGPPAEQAFKRKVVVARFSNETSQGKTTLPGEDKSMIGRTASEMLAARLFETRKFVLFQCKDPGPYLEALDAGRLHEIDLPADYLIVGSLSEFGRSTTGDSGLSKRGKVQRIHARVNVRLIDVRASRVICSKDGTGEAQANADYLFGMGDYDASLRNQALSAAISKLEKEIMKSLMAQPWRAYLVSAEEDQLVISGGASQGLTLGRQLALVKRGKTIDHPQTGDRVEYPGEKAAVLEITSLFGDRPEEEGAFCKVVSGTGPASESEFPEYVVEELKQ